MHEAEIMAKYKASAAGAPETAGSVSLHLDPVMFAHMLPTMIVSAEAHKSNLEMLVLLEEIPVKIYAAEQKQILEKYSPEECEQQLVDLRPFMDRESTVVCGIETLSKTYNLFRTMGHHHVFVTKDRPIVEGLICRKDLLEDIAKLKLGEKANRCKMNVMEGALTLSTIPFLPVEGQRKKRKNEEDPTEEEEEEEMAEEDAGPEVVVSAPRSPGRGSPSPAPRSPCLQSPLQAPPAPRSPSGPGTPGLSSPAVRSSPLRASPSPPPAAPAPKLADASAN